MASNERNSGFIFLHRRLRDHWLWNDPTKLKWWLDILMECNHEDKKVSIGFQLIDCKRGQSVNSLLTWAKRWRVNKDTVRRYFDMLKNDSMIATENVQKTTRLTVCNYGQYNDIKHDSALKSRPSRADPATMPNSDTSQTKNELNNEERSIGASAPNYKKMTEKDFYNAIAAFKNDYPKDLLREFYDYWREPAPDGRMLFQLKKTWSLNLRLKRWQSNNLPEFKKKPENKIEQGAPPLQKI